MKVSTKKNAEDRRPEEDDQDAEVTLHVEVDEADDEAIIVVEDEEGVDELDLEKLPALLRLKYRGAIADAIAELGSPEEIRQLFAEFQKFLYQEAA